MNLTVIRISSGFYTIYNVYEKNRTGHRAPSPVFVELRITVRCISVSKAIWSCHGGKSSGTGDNNTIRAAAAMDDQEIAVCVRAADNADVGIVWIEYKIARLCVAP